MEPDSVLCGPTKDDREKWVGLCDEAIEKLCPADGDGEYEKVDVKAVTPGMEKKALEVIAANPNIRAILMECTELPPYSDALRAKLNLPVPRAIPLHTAQSFLFTPRIPPLHRL